MTKIKSITNIHINNIKELKNEQDIIEFKENKNQITKELIEEIKETIFNAFKVPKESIKVKVKYEVVEE